MSFFHTIHWFRLTYAAENRQEFCWQGQPVAELVFLTRKPLDLSLKLIFLAKALKLTDSHLGLFIPLL
jgi:hypothetical protein